MKHIIKDIRNEPNVLKEHRSTPNTRYKSFGDALKMPLCNEQGFICCYCMQRIESQTTTVEHYITQTKHKDSNYSAEEHKAYELDYMNMLASCNYKNGRNCSEIRGNIPLYIDPKTSLIESQIGYNPGGVIYAIDKNENVVNDLKTLKLGVSPIPDIDENGEYWLIKNRAKIIEEVRQKLDTKGWTKPNIEAEIKKFQIPDKEGYLQPYCQVAIFYLKKKLKIYLN
jgi:hypothetical protein